MTDGKPSITNDLLRRCCHRDLARRLNLRRFGTQPPRLQQHRFLSRPHRFDMGWVVRVAHYAAREECGVHIPLHYSRPITQHMPPLTERLLCANFGDVVVLRHFQRPSVLPHLGVEAVGIPAFRQGRMSIRCSSKGQGVTFLCSFQTDYLLQFVDNSNSMHISIEMPAS